MSRLACLLFVALALAASGCVTAQAKGEPGGPALAPPDPPPHTVNPVQIAEKPPAQDAPRAVVADPTPAPKPKSEKSAEKPAEKPPDAAAAAPPPAAPALGPPLQTTPNATGVEGEIRKVMTQAESDLRQVDRETLKNTDRNLQFNTARRFLQEAEEALKVKNLVFAREIADKAATLAAALAKK